MIEIRPWLAWNESDADMRVHVQLWLDVAHRASQVDKAAREKAPFPEFRNPLGTAGRPTPDWWRVGALLDVFRHEASIAVELAGASDWIVQAVRSALFMPISAGGYEASATLPTAKQMSAIGADPAPALLALITELRSSEE